MGFSRSSQGEGLRHTSSSRGEGIWSEISQATYGRAAMNSVLIRRTTVCK